MLSSGMGSSEIRSLTIDDLIYALKLPKDVPFNIEVLINLDPSNSLIIPEWNITRIKTGREYTTFSTPESLTAIISYLIKYPPLNNKSPLFRTARSNNPVTANTFSMFFLRLNNTCNFRKNDRLAFFRSHALRKYFATTLYKIGLPQLSIDWFLGHKIDKPTNAYFKMDTGKLKKQYITCIEKLSIEDVEVHVFEDSGYKEIKQLRKEVNDLTDKLDRKYDILKTQKELDEPIDKPE